MPGPYIISDLTLLTSLVNKDAVVEEGGSYGIQCVGLVKVYARDSVGNKIPRTSEWSPGSAVKDANSACAPGAPAGIDRGTAIATFNKDGRYLSNPSGNHACFFVEFQKDGSGFVVLEQHVKPHEDKIQWRVLTYKGKPKEGRIEVDNGDGYSVIL